MWTLFDAPIAETGVLTEETGKVWYDSLVGGLRPLSKEEMKGRGEEAVFGFEFPSTFRINTQVYLQWFVCPPSSHPIHTHKTHRLQAQALAKGVTLIRRHYASVQDVLSDHPPTTFLVNCTGLGSLALSDIKDTDLYPTRGQTYLVAEPKEAIEKMYEMEAKYGSFQTPSPALFQI
jgi:D-amino-acid oxidase